MAYSALDDIKAQISEEELIQLTDDEGQGSVNEARVTRAIADADEEIDGYLGSRHSVPLSPVPGIVRKISVELAIYNLFARRNLGVPEARQKRYENALRFLERVAEGRISLGASDPEGSPPTVDRPELAVENPVRIFDRTKMQDF